MFYSCSFNSGIEIIAHFTLIVKMHFSAEERRDIIGFHGMNRRCHQLIVYGLQILPAFEDYVRGIFRLHNAPMAASVKFLYDGAELTGKQIEFFVNFVNGELIVYFLSLFKGGKVSKHIIKLRETDRPAVQH
jgi:hypothetical protein